MGKGMPKARLLMLSINKPLFCQGRATTVDVTHVGEEKLQLWM